MIKGSKVSSRHWSVKDRAQKLRSKGFSYTEILQRVNVSKSTISLWCRNIQLTKSQRDRLHSKRGDVMAGVKVMQKYFWRKREEYFYRGSKSVPALGKTNRFLAGLVLYWAEGTKQKNPDITNSDPRVIKFMVSWFREFYNIKPENLVIHLHLHTGQNEQDMKQYWSELTGIPLSNFQKSFIKPEGSGYRKKILYNGTVKLRVRGKGSTYLLFQILGAIAGVLKNLVNEAPKPEDWMQRLPYV